MEDDSDGERPSKVPPDNLSSPSKGLSRFAYKLSLPSRTSPSVDPAPSRPVRAARKDPLDPQLARLSKCIGCGLQWTSRKTVKQKRTHIEQCAKKNALNKDTVKILIQKEIAISSSRTPANDPGENATGTLIDSLVPTAPVKKHKRHQVVPTVRSLPETRESILDRARDILGPTEGQADPQPTQQFGQSALARRNTPKRPALLDVNWSVEEPPPTQQFGTSSLRRRMMASERLVGGYEELSLVPTPQFAQDFLLLSDCVSVSPPRCDCGAHLVTSSQA